MDEHFTKLYSTVSHDGCIQGSPTPCCHCHLGSLTSLETYNACDSYRHQVTEEARPVMSGSMESGLESNVINFKD